MTPDEARELLGRVGAASRLNALAMDVSDFELLNLSFSLTGEDLALRKWMKAKLRAGERGFYVDLGAADPRLASNTYLFYCYGWRGVCVDANPTPELQAAYAKHRPRDAFVSAAVGVYSRPMFWAQHKSNFGMSRIAAEAEGFGRDFRAPVAIKTMALRDILTAHVPAGTAIDFMSVDLEETELPALQSNDWVAFRPNIMLVEAEGVDAAAPQDHPSIAYLVKLGYRCASVIGPNVLLRSET